MNAQSTDNVAKLSPLVPTTEQPAYPGSEATIEQFVGLADEYLAAAHALLSQVSRKRSLSSAPARLCAIHAVEMYLNAFLISHGIEHRQVRGFRHDVAQRAVMATEKGLRLRVKTQAHLLKIHDQREYLVVRYGPEQAGGLSELNRMFATLNEISTKVRTALLKQPHPLRFQQKTPISPCVASPS